MRILMIIDGLDGGGAEKTVLTLSNGFLKMGHKVSLFSLRKSHDYPVPEGVDFQIIQDTYKKPWSKLTEVCRRAKLLDLAIIKAENHEKFDIVFSHLHQTDRIVAHSRALNRNKVWFCIHSMLSFAYLKNRCIISRWLKYLKIFYTYEKRNIVAVSSAVLNDIKDTMSIHPSKSIVIHNPFDINTIQHKAKEPFEMKGKDYLICLGRLHEHKRHDRLLRAYALSKISAPLVIMGNGSSNRIVQLKTLAKKLNISKQILFRKFSLNPYPWIKGARLLVLSSDFEGFSNVLVEAIICKTPIVSTRCPGGPEEILTGSLARGFSGLSERELAEKLSDIYTNPPIVNHETIYSYDVQKICQKYVFLIQNTHA